MSCFDGWDGEVTIDVSGGYPPYQFIWQDLKTENYRKQLKSGNYAVEILDNASCIFSDSVVIDQPDLMELLVITTPSLCQDSTGTAEAIVNGGSLAYEFYWSNGLTGQDALEQLPSGEYSLTVIDTNHCVAYENFEISDANGPDLLVTITDSVSCSGNSDGEAFVEIGSGNSPFTCIWLQNADTGITSSKLRAGESMILVTDNNGCMSYSTFIMPAPEPIIITITSVPALCGQQNGELHANVSGGSGMYSFQWTSGSTDSISSGLGSGFDTLVVTDALGCNSTSIGEVELIDGPEFNITVLNQVSCFGNNDGKARVEVTDGIPPYTYLWSIDSISDMIADDLPAGEFTVTVTDSLGCSVRKNFYIEEPPELNVAFYYQPPTSDSALDGLAEAIVDGGVPPYNFYWLNSGSTARSISDVGVGTETLIVTDVTGCQAQEQRTILSRSSTCYRTNIPACPQIVPAPSCAGSPCVLNIVTDFLADPTGLLNSQCAFEAAADFFNARNGNGTLIIPAGNYLVGKQVPLHPPYTAQHPFWNTGNDVLCFENCVNLAIEGQFSNNEIATKIKFEDCMMYGMFDTATGERYIADSPFGPMGCGLDSVNRNYHKIATPGNFLVLNECGNVTVSNLDVDGNSDHLSYGGHYCDGIQAPASGILLNSSSKISINNVNIHHFGLDGIQISDLSLFIERKYMNINISNSKFNWNGRVGFHWNSGRRVNVVSCEFNYNALARFGSKAADGVDFENDGGGAPVELGNFVKCDFLYNSYAGIECSPAQAKYVRDMTFTSCNFASGESIGSSFAAIPGGKNFDFRLCKFYGSIIHAHHARISHRGANNNNVKFRGINPNPNPNTPGCIFNEEFRSYSMNADTNDECNTGLTNNAHRWLLDFNAARVLFQNCIINSNRQMKLINVGGGTYYTPHNYAVFEYCNLNNFGLSGTNNIGSVYAVDIRNCNLNILSGSNYSISYNGPAIGQFNKQAVLSPPVPFCKPKYFNPPYPDKVLDAFNCDSCVTRKPPFCPQDTSQGCDPCTKLYKPVSVDKQQGELSVHPNPSNEKIRVTNLEKNTMLNIYSMLGERILSIYTDLGEVEVNISGLQTGIYLIQNGQSKRAKFIKSD